MHFHKSILNKFAFLFLTITFSGCSSMQYLLQAGQGQFEILNHSRPVAEIIRDEKTNPRLKALLEEIGPIKKYGETRGLKPTANYQEFVKLNRDAAVWVVSACEPLQFKSREWKFPIVGSFPFLGWFDLGNAKQFAAELKITGLDVDVRGASAYSTLGWFRDPLLSTMISEKPDGLGRLVNVILHESVHATLYITNQSYLNESVASFIADHLTLDYLDATRGPDSVEKRAYNEMEKRGEKISREFHTAYERLDQLYRNLATPPEEKLQVKKQILNELQKDLALSREVTNATLVQYKTYNSGKAELDALFRCSHGDWSVFMAHLKALPAEAFHQSNQAELHSVLAPTLHEICPADQHLSFAP